MLILNCTVTTSNTYTVILTIKNLDNITLGLKILLLLVILGY